MPSLEQRAKATVGGYCPFCGKDEKRFFVNTETGEWRCYDCGDGGDLIDLVARMENTVRDRAQILLAEILGPSPIAAEAPTRAPPRSPERHFAAGEHAITRWYCFFGATSAHRRTDYIVVRQLSLRQGPRLSLAPPRNRFPAAELEAHLSLHKLVASHVTTIILKKPDIG